MQYYDRLRAEFPQMPIDLVDHHTKVDRSDFRADAVRLHKKTPPERGFFPSRLTGCRLRPRTGRGPALVLAVRQLHLGDRPEPDVFLGFVAGEAVERQREVGDE